MCSFVAMQMVPLVEKLHSLAAGLLRLDVLNNSCMLVVQDQDAEGQFAFAKLFSTSAQALHTVIDRGNVTCFPASEGDSDSGFQVDWAASVLSQL